MPTAAEYREQLKQLLPPGQAFPRDPGTTLHDLLDGMSIELARVDERGFALPLEANPNTTNELLSDWERVAGLPDRCSGVLEETIQGRRNALLAKLASTGGQSIPYFISIAAALGYQVTITEFRPFRVGLSKVGDALTNGDWQFAWQVNAPETTVVSFRVGMSAVGEALRTWGAGSLECKIRQLAPAHTIPIFAYANSSLDLLFDSDTYLLNQQTSSFASLVTFTRAGAGGRWNAAGVYEMIASNLPRFDYDPITHAPLGILIEEPRTNILFQSAALENAYWNKSNCNVTVSATPAPDGSGFMRQLLASAPGSVALSKGPGAISSIHTESFFVKAGTCETCTLRFYDTIGEAARASFSLTTGAVLNSSGPVLAGFTITPVGGDIWRITLTADYSARSSAGLAVYLYVNSYIGAVAGESILAWGAQLEAGAFATSYIPTVATAVTRGGDNAILSDLGPWYSQAHGTFFVEFTQGQIGVGSVGNYVYASSAVSSQNRIVLRNGLGQGNIYGTTSNGAAVLQSEVYGGTIQSGTPGRAALAIALNDVGISLNGRPVITDALAELPTPDRIGIGSATSGATQYANSTIKRIRYYPRRLSDAELITLTAS